MTLEVTDAARKRLAQRGWDPVYPERHLKRAIQSLVPDPLAMMLLEGKFSDGDGELTFDRLQPRRSRGNRLAANRPGRRQREVDQVCVDQLLRAAALVVGHVPVAIAR